MKYQVYGNALIVWATALGSMMACTLALVVLRRILVKNLHPRATSRAAAFWWNAAAGLLRGTRSLSILAISVFVASQLLSLPVKAEYLLGKLTLLVVLGQLLLWGSSLITMASEFYITAHDVTDRSRATSVRAFAFLGRVALFTLIILGALDNLGVNVTALIAGLGVGGVAIALAVQNILSDLFASLTIVLDKPFVLGDFIITDEFQGTVENIGLKTTRLRSLGGEQLVFPNAGLLQSRIRNYRRMQERRVVFGFGLVYETPLETLRKVPGLVRSIVEAQPKTRFDRAHFKSYGPSSLDFEIVYWMLDPDYNTYMDTQQTINFALFAALAELGAAFAYPTQTVYVQSNQPRMT